MPPEAVAQRCGMAQASLSQFQGFHGSACICDSRQLAAAMRSATAVRMAHSGTVHLHVHGRDGAGMSRQPSRLGPQPALLVQAHEHACTAGAMPRRNGRSHGLPGPARGGSACSRVLRRVAAGAACVAAEEAGAEMSTSCGDVDVPGSSLESVILAAQAEPEHDAVAVTALGPGRVAHSNRRRCAKRRTTPHQQAQQRAVLGRPP